MARLLCGTVTPSQIIARLCPPAYTLAGALALAMLLSPGARLVAAEAAEDVPGFATNLHPVDETARQRTLQALRSHVDVKLADLPLGRALEDLRNKGKINMMVAWETIREDTGVEQDVPVTLTANDISLGHALDLLLKAVSPDEQNPLSWFVTRQGVLLISARSHLNEVDVTVRCYDLRPVLLTPEEQTRRVGRPRALDAADEADPAGGNTFGPGVSGPEQGWNQVLSLTEQIEATLTLIRNNVGQQASWDNYGGTLASATPVHQMLIVRAPLSYHQEIEALLGQLAEKLHGRRISVEFQGTPLRLALAEIRRLVDRNMAVNWRQLAKVGVQPDTPVTLQLREVPALTVLNLLLEQVADDAVLVERDGVLAISAPPALPKLRSTPQDRPMAPDDLDPIPEPVAP